MDLRFICLFCVFKFAAFLQESEKQPYVFLVELVFYSILEIKCLKMELRFCSLCYF